MPKQDYYNFGSGGMNTQTGVLILKDNECELIQNYTLDILGNLVKRNGNGARKVAQVVDGVPILGMFFFRDSQGTDNSNILVTCRDGTPGTNADTYKISSSAWAKSLEDDTKTSLPIFFTFVDKVFRVNGTEKVSSSSDLSTWTNVDTPDTNLPDLKPKYGCVWEDRVYVANENGTTKYPSRIFWSSLPSSAGALTWVITTDYADINPDDNDSITWIEPFGTKLLVFKSFGLYRWTFGQVEPDKIIDIGTHQGRTVKQMHGICFWADHVGAYAYTGTSMPKLISKKIQKWFDAIPSGNNWTNMRAEVDEDHYYLYIGDVTVDNVAYTNVLLVYTISLDAWHIETYPFEIMMMARVESGTYGSIGFNEGVYIGDDDGFIYQLNFSNPTSSAPSSDNNGATSGVPINGKIITKEYPLANFPKTSILQNLYFLAQKGGGAKINYRFDRGQWEPWKDLSTRITEGALAGRARTIQLMITDNSGTISQLEGFSVETETEETKEERRKRE